MTHSELEVGGIYMVLNRVRLVPARLDAIQRFAPGVFTYHVTNLKTDRKIVFRSAAKFMNRVMVKTDG